MVLGSWLNLSGSPAVPASEECWQRERGASEDSPQCLGHGKGAFPIVAGVGWGVGEGTEGVRKLPSLRIDLLSSIIGHWPPFLSTSLNLLLSKLQPVFI